MVDGSPARLEAAKTFAALGGALRRQRRPSDAREPLRRALELSVGCGARALEDHARGELYAAGGRPRAVALTGVASLTAQERRVAELAAEGATNREDRTDARRDTEDGRSPSQQHVSQARRPITPRARGGPALRRLNHRGVPRWILGIRSRVALACPTAGAVVADPVHVAEEIVVHLRLMLAGESLTGWASDDRGAERRFDGRLGLLAAIDALDRPRGQRGTIDGGNVTRVHRTRAVGAALAIALVVGACSNGDDDAATTTRRTAASRSGRCPTRPRRSWTRTRMHRHDGCTTWPTPRAERCCSPTGLTSSCSPRRRRKGSPSARSTTRSAPDTRLTTPVYATTPIGDGVVDGDLVLVASGDLALGGRNAMEGRFDHTFDVDSVDHVYADFAPNATRVGDPLAGLDDLARQIAEQGVDPRRWRRRHRHQHLERLPRGRRPGPADLRQRQPRRRRGHRCRGRRTGDDRDRRRRPDYFTVESDVETVAEDGETALSVTASEDDPSTLVVSGTIAAGHSQLTMYRVPDAADWARALFIEALERAGIEVAAQARRLERRVGARGLRQLPGGSAGGRAHVAHAWPDGDDDHGDELQHRAPTRSCACSPSSAARRTASTAWRRSTS